MSCYPGIPRLVHGVISGYGHSSSRAAWPALDFVVQAHAGVLAVTGPDPDTGVKAGVPIADLSAGLYSVIGVLAALRRAEQTGRGRPRRGGARRGVRIAVHQPGDELPDRRDASRARSATRTRTSRPTR